MKTWQGSQKKKVGGKVGRVGKRDLFQRGGGAAKNFERDTA